MNMDFCKSTLNLFRHLSNATPKASSDYDTDLTEYRDSLINEERNIISTLEEKGFNLVGVGRGRIVLSVPNRNVVVKVARFGDTLVDDGVRQNYNEVETWKSASSEVNLAPIIDFDGEEYLWVAMPRLDPLSEVVKDEAERELIVDTLQDQLFNADIFVKLLDVRVENIGVNDKGDILLMDYGLSGDD